MRIGPHDIGVCSWSLRATGMEAMIEAVRSLGLSHWQLALTPLVLAEETARREQIELIKNSGLTLAAGMIGFPGEDYSSIASIRRTGGLAPNIDWPRRRDIAQQALTIARDLGITKISTHIGFVPPSNQENYAVMVDRVCETGGIFAAAGVDLLMETGQEPAAQLLQFLHDIPCKNIRINFDPANMILYGAGDPIEAIHILGQHIDHVHVKDALASPRPTIDWGREVPFGSGQVDPAQFLAALSAAHYGGPLTVEREGRAPNPLADIRAAIEALQTSASIDSPGQRAQ